MGRRKNRKKFLVDVFHTYAHSVVVEAKDEDEAQRIVEKAEADGRIDPAGFRKTDDCEVEVYGEVDNSGPFPWPELEVKDGKKHCKVHEGRRAHQ